MSIKRIFIAISAIFAASAVFADNSSVTSKKYVDDLMSGYQGKLPGSGANTLMIYDNSEDGIGEKAIAATLGNSASAVSVPTVGAVKTGLDGKQDTITGTAGYVMTGTGNAGEVGAKPIYSANTNYTDSLVTAETVNTGVINAVNNSLIRVDENGAPSDSGTLWEINTSLFAINAKVPYGYTELQYVVFSGDQYIDTGIVLTNPQNIENVINVKLHPYYLTNSFQTLIGFMSASTTPRYGINVYNNRWMLGINATTSGVETDSNQHTFKFVTTGDRQTLYDTDGSVLVSSSLSVTGFDSNTISLYVGARHQPSSIGNYVYGNIGKTYLKQNGIMLYDYIPAQRDSDNAVGFYDVVSGNFLTHSGLAAGPTCVSPNLFDKTNGEYINAYVHADTGMITQGTTQYCFVVPVQPNTTYVLSGMSSASTWGAFPNKTVGTTATTKMAGNGSITTGPNDRYLIGMAYATGSQYDYRDTLQIELGSTATTYRPYGENICD